MLRNFDSHLKSIQTKKAKQAELKDKEDSGLDDLRRRERNLASTQGGLIANRKVSPRVTLVPKLKKAELRAESPRT